MPDQYTHKFKYEVNGVFIRGECEFDTDEKATFKILEWSQPIPLTTIQDFCDVMEKCKWIYDNSDSKISQIQVKQKEAV